MVRPFDIEEIFPEVVVGPPRRRQTGGSAQGLAVTLIADYTLRTRAWLPSGAIVALLGEFGVTPGAARTSISRLARQGILERSRQGRYSSYRLTEDAAIDLSYGGTAIAAIGADSDSWDGLWTVVVFSMPEQESTRRRALREHLRWNGYAPLYDGVWISPDPPSPEGRAELAAVALGAVTVFRARHLELEAEADRSPVEAWDLAAIAKEYETFTDQWSPLVPRIAAGAVTDAAAVRARTEVMDVYRRFPVLDPMLPVVLLPPEWPRRRARDLFVQVYDGLLRPGQDHVRAVVAGVADGYCPEIQAHTVADMAAGIRQAAD